MTGAHTARVAAAGDTTPGLRLTRALDALDGDPDHGRDLLTELSDRNLPEVADGLSELRGPLGTTAAILSRLALRDLPAPTRRILRAAALLRVRFDAAELSDATAIPLPRVAMALTAGIEHGVLGSHGRYLVFRSDMVRRGCAGTHTRRARRRFHRSAALALLAAGAAPEPVAHHLSHAGDLPGPAIGWLARVPEAVLFTQPALFAALLRRARAGDRAEGCVLAARRAAVHLWLGHHAAVVSIASGHDCDRLVRLAVRACVHSGQFTAAARLCTGRTQPALMAWHAVALAGLGDYGRARERLTAIGSTADDPLAAAVALHARILTGQAGDVISGRPHVDFGTVLGRLPVDVEGGELRVLLHGDLIDVLVQTGPPDALDRAFAEVPDLARTADPRRAAGLWAVAARAAYLTARDDPAVTTDPDLVRLLEVLDGARETKTASAARPYQIEAYAVSAERSGDPGLALRLRRTLLDRAFAVRPAHLHGAEHVLRLALTTGDTALAESTVRRCEHVAQSERLPAQRATVLLLRAMLDGDATRLLTAADDLGRVAAPRQQAFALEEAAVCLAREGERGAAGRLLRDVAQRYSAQRRATDVARADERLREHGVRRRAPADRPASGWAALSPAELRVARLVARGLSTPEVAAELYLSPNTVQTHLSRIRGKLGLRSRLEIARACWSRGEPHPDGDGLSRPAR
ncbi:LuxR C-terminal-related transcriptional regulator [Dactylosporangium sp. NPDC005555]|uniref:LuxR C-terminal-related transcriptional regulator n=1 Tax=Dactylosporangium sp. NPDC005555 TaxID=3154889 RepID=UPI0033BA315F